MNDVFGHHKVSSFRFQISFVDAIVEFVIILGLLLVVAGLTFEEKAQAFSIFVLVGVEQVVARFTISLACELSLHLYFLRSSRTLLQYALRVRLPASILTNVLH